MDIQTQSLLSQIIATTLEDPLIDWKTQRTIELFLWVFVIATAGVVGLISRRLENALFFAFVSSIITIAFFVIG